MTRTRAPGHCRSSRAAVVHEVLLALSTASANSEPDAMADDPCCGQRAHPVDVALGHVFDDRHARQRRLRGHAMEQFHGLPAAETAKRAADDPRHDRGVEAVAVEIHEDRDAFRHFGQNGDAVAIEPARRNDPGSLPDGIFELPWPC